MDVQPILDATIGNPLVTYIALGGAAVLSILPDSFGEKVKSTASTVIARVRASFTRAPATPAVEPAVINEAESRKAVLLSIRHRASELPAGEERIDALAICDNVDALSARLWSSK